MRSRIGLLVFILLSVTAVSLAEVPEVRFYPFGELSFCKGCGHFKDDFWKLKFRLENRSGRDLFVYGTRFDGDENFDFMSGVQYRNPHICEWQYGNGRSEKLAWKERTSLDKSIFILKAGETVISERGISLNGSGTTPTRFTAHIATNIETEPYEIFSDSYVEVPAGATNGRKPSFRIVDETCSPQCKIGMESSPLISGVRLGMTLENFRKQFPKTEIHGIHADRYNYKLALLWDWKNDAFRSNITFVDDSVGRIETQFRSLNRTRHRTDFYRLVADKIRLPYFWEPYGSRWECKDFLIDVTTNEDPTISVESKVYIKVRDQINEEYTKRLR